jgi:NAD(P)-dependent dehydrogenase (short-subunit alcohol dehydrogenase family)
MFKLLAAMALILAYGSSSSMSPRTSALRKTAPLPRRKGRPTTSPVPSGSTLVRCSGPFGRLDIAFNNAGVEQPVTPAADITEEEWDRIVDIDLRSVFLCMKYEIPLMLEQGGGGAIVNTSSGAGVKGMAGQAAYCAAKWGVVGLTKGDGARLRSGEHPCERRVPGHHRPLDDRA